MILYNLEVAAPIILRATRWLANFLDHNYYINNNNLADLRLDQFELLPLNSSISRIYHNNNNSSNRWFKTMDINIITLVSTCMALMGIDHFQPAPRSKKMTDSNKRVWNSKQKNAIHQWDPKQLQIDLQALDLIKQSKTIWWAAWAIAIIWAPLEELETLVYQSRKIIF